MRWAIHGAELLEHLHGLEARDLEVERLAAIETARTSSSALSSLSRSGWVCGVALSRSFQKRGYLVSRCTGDEEGLEVHPLALRERALLVEEVAEARHVLAAPRVPSAFS